MLCLLSIAKGHITAISFIWGQCAQDGISIFVALEPLLLLVCSKHILYLLSYFHCHVSVSFGLSEWDCLPPLLSGILGVLQVPWDANRRSSAIWFFKSYNLISCNSLCSANIALLIVLRWVSRTLRLYEKTNGESLPLSIMRHGVNLGNVLTYGNAMSHPLGTIRLRFFTSRYLVTLSSICHTYGKALRRMEMLFNIQFY